MIATQVHGEIAAGLEPVRERFAADVAEVGEGGAAFAVLTPDATLVDLWAGHAGPDEWREDTRAVLMSATKGLAVVALARLAERGELDVEGPIARYWPEFAAGGKANITIAQLLCHSAGLITVPGYEEILGPDGSGWSDSEAILARLASAVPLWPPGSAVGYHGFTFGWLVGEIAHRVAGKSIGSIVRDEIAAPLGLDLDLGTPSAHQRHVARIAQPGDRVTATPEQARVLADPDSLASRMLLAVNGRTVLDNAASFFTDPAILELELAGSNATATARSLALVYAALAGEGAIGAYNLLAPDTIRAFSAERAKDEDIINGARSRWSLGFQRPVPSRPGVPRIWGPNDEAFGNIGYGGQFGLADPVARIGIVFVRSHLSATSPLGANLVQALYACLSDG